MDIGIHIASFEWGEQPLGSTFKEIAQTAEHVGATHLTAMDHFFQLPMIGGVDKPILEGYSMLAFAAGVTERIRLHLLVGGVTYRNPGIVAKTVSSLDQLSSGRAEMGIGAAWFEQEHHGLGVRFPSTSERFERLEECLQISRQMWSADEGPYEGKHFQMAETIDVPGTFQDHLPIMIGGSGPKKTLRMVAEYGDACNISIGGFGKSPEEYAASLSILQRHCDDLGRDYDQITKTVMWSGIVDPATFSAELEAYADHQIDRVYVMPFGDDPVGFIKALGPTVSELASS